MQNVVWVSEEPSGSPPAAAPAMQRPRAKRVPTAHLVQVLPLAVHDTQLRGEHCRVEWGGVEGGGKIGEYKLLHYCPPPPSCREAQTPPHAPASLSCPPPQ